MALRTTGQYAGNPIFPTIDREVSIGDPTIKRSAKHGGALEDSGFFCDVPRGGGGVSARLSGGDARR